MHADLDTLCITVYCMADDLLPAKAKNHRRELTDAEIITLAVAQAIMGIPKDERFLATARKRLRHLFPKLPKRPVEAARPALRADRGARRGLRPRVPRLPRSGRPARLHPGRM